jgi:Transposase
LAERRQHDTVGRPQLWPRDLTPQHLQLVPQQQDLHLLPLLGTSEQQQQLQQAAQQPIGEGKALSEQTLDRHAQTLRPGHDQISARQERRTVAGPALSNAATVRLHHSNPLRATDEFLGPTGAVVFEAKVAANSAGYRQALVLGEEHAPGRRVFAAEGTGSFGAGLTRLLTGRGERVLEVGRLRRERRSGGKTDALDAVRAARSVLASARQATPRAGGEREALQALVAAREGAVNAKRAGLCQLRDLLITTRSRCGRSCGRSHARGSCSGSRQHGQTADEIQSCAAACSRSARLRDASCN